MGGEFRAKGVNVLLGPVAGPLGELSPAQYLQHWVVVHYLQCGVHVLVAEYANRKGPLGRTVTGGRNWEGISPDPYLSGALVFETVIGVQSTGVITSTKHFIANE